MILAYTVTGDSAVVDSIDEFRKALADDAVGTVILARPSSGSSALKINADTVLDGMMSNGQRKTIQVETPFLPDTGEVRIATDSAGKTYIASPAAGTYSTYRLFEVAKGVKLTLENMVLMGGFTGSVTVDETATTGGIDNYGHLEMRNVDILRTGTAVLNRSNARALLVDCNIVRNANWYGGGVLNFSERVSGTDTYINGGTFVMDSCSLTENESLGPQHGGGAAENQGVMCLNNCIIANNASTEIGGGINNCKGGALFVMNSTFIGNVTTSESYGKTAGGAIGNAGGASHVHIVNSILAYNGYDDGEFVDSSSLGRYKGSTDTVSCTIFSSIYDAVEGMESIDDAGSTLEYRNIFNSVESQPIVSAGSATGTTSYFEHPLVVSADPENDPNSLSPSMTSQPEDHYIFANAVTTYFDYSGIWDEPAANIGIAFETNGVRTALGKKVSDTDNKVVVGYAGADRVDNNFIGAAGVPVRKEFDPEPDPFHFWVKLGEFSGGKVSGVTVYGDSYRSNSVVMVHAVANSAHYLDGWTINGETVQNSAQKYVFSFAVTTNIVIAPIFSAVQTRIFRVRQRYPWNNLVDIDYSVSEENAVLYRLVFFATYTDDAGNEKTVQLRSFVKNDLRSEHGYIEQRLGEKENLRKAGEHRVTWDSAKDGVNLKGRDVHIQLLACEGDER